MAINGNGAAAKNLAIFSKPDYLLLGKLGLNSVDMHSHTLYSDTMTKIDNIMRKANRQGIGVAITDHNEVKGVVKACDNRYGVMIVPGIEVSCIDGPHILVYFYNVSDLILFYDRHISKLKEGTDPNGTINIKVEELLNYAEYYKCVTSAAHPYGYKISDLGLIKCIRKGYLGEAVLNRINAIEAICGGAPRNLNQKACLKAEELGKPITGGSDAHTLFELGRVVTSSYAEDVDTILDNITKKKNYVIGTEAKLLPKIVEAGKILAKHLKYPGPSIRNQYRLNFGRRAKKAKERLVGRMRKREPAE
jgi:predicted metal-dependent phosphoesterase TrpH